MLVSGNPVGFNFQLVLLRAAFSQRDCAMTDVAHFGGVFGLDGFGVVPEIEAVNVAVVEPQASVVRMVDALARARFEREAAGDDGAFGGAKGIEDGLGELFGPDVSGEALAVDGNLDAAFPFVGASADSFRERLLPCGEAADEECGYGYCPDGWNCGACRQDAGVTGRAKGAHCLRRVYISG